MTRDTGSPAIPGRAFPDAFRRASQEPSLPPSLSRCADAALARGEPIAASAGRYRRYLLLEVPGPWGAAALDERHVGARVAGSLARAAADANANVLLIRRPGRQRPAAASAESAGSAPRAWAIADTAPEAERVLWGSWDTPDDLLRLDLAAPLPVTAAASGPQRVALICTNGKRDQCCAIRGRPVAEALAAVPGWDSWESTHLGGHRFAATIMLLPTGDMFGWLDQPTAVAAVERFDAGQFLLSHYRGRSGQPLPAQAALHAAAVRLGDSRRHAFRLVEIQQVPRAKSDDAERWEVLVSHLAERGTEVTYRVTVARGTPSPALLSCSDESPKAEARYAAVSVTRAGLLRAGPRRRTRPAARPDSPAPPITSAGPEWPARSVPRTITARFSRGFVPREKPCYILVLPKSSNSPWCTPPMKACHSSGVNRSTGPSRSRLFRTPTVPPGRSETSTQLPLAKLSELFTQVEPAIAAPAGLPAIRVPTLSLH